MKSTLTFIISLMLLSGVSAQSNYWAETSEQRMVLPAESEVAINASSYRTLSLDLAALRASLAAAPMEFTPAAQDRPAQVSLPLPDGRMEVFELVESPVMAPGLAVKYPNIRAYAARSTERPMCSARIEVSPQGLTAAVVAPEGKIFIEPYATQQNRYHISYYKRDLQFDELPLASCGYDDAISEELALEEQLAISERGELSFRSSTTVPLRTYRLALVCTGEFGQNNGGTVEGVLAAFNTAVSRLNQTFQPEVAVRMEMIERTEELIFLNAAGDPFQNANMGRELLGQNQNFLNGAIGAGSYDIGHIFTGGCSDVGGVVSGTVCTSGKGRGVTCHSSSNINFIVDRIMTHEIAHQFAVGHSWNNCPGDALEQLSSANAYEPGSGSTIMSYAGSCGNQNIAFNSDTYYNIGSLIRFTSHAREGNGSTCGTETSTDNHFPVIEWPYEDGFWIPISTPFELSASATDEDGDELTYVWEQFDLGPVADINNPIGNAPTFRSIRPATNGSKRVFPSLNKVISNNYDNTEVLPTYERDLTFQFVVRDNHPEHGSAVWEKVAFKATANAGPFVVLQPNTSDEEWQGGEYREVSWDVANTDNNRVNCQYVDILLSVNGGQTYPYTLLERTPNDGSAFVDVPDVSVNNARIRVQASDNIFFDISDANFRIAPATEPGYSVNVSPATIALVCLPSEPLAITISTAAILDFDSTLQLSLVGELPAGAVATFENTELLPGEQTTLLLDIPPQEGRDTINLQVQTLVPGVDTSLRELRIIHLSSDYTDLALSMPVDGESEVLFSTDFSWVDVPSAEAYDIEIATNASFSETSIFERASGLTENEYTPETFFEEDRLYFWRVRPENDCGPGEYLDPFAFRTATVDCNSYLPSDLPINLSNNPGERTSTIFVTESGTISDLRINDLEISYTPISVLQVSITSPAGTEVLLFDRSCLNTSLLRATYDDSAPSEINCPPITTLPIKPEEPLSAFIGENTFGEWTLKVKIVSSGFGGGTLRKWGLRFCAAVTPAVPTLITNEPFSVPPGAGNTITTDFLAVEDAMAEADQIKYILLREPANGQLFRAGQLLRAGDHFTQQTINVFNLTYVHDGSDTQADDFTFVVENAEGGWIPTQTFQIVIDEDAAVGTADEGLGRSLKIFPNPAQSQLNVVLGQAIDGPVSLQLATLHGQLVEQRQFTTVDGALQMDVSRLPAGIYLLSVRTASAIVSRKVVVQ